MDTLAAATHTGSTPVAATPRLSASWQRSEDYGAPLEQVAPVYLGSVDEESRFFQCGQQVLRGLDDRLANESVSVMLTDHDGHVLSRTCHDRALVTALDNTYLAPGFAFSEREAGTNGLGLALADRAPSLVRGGEHYCTSLWLYTCAAAPVLDPVHGLLLGTINLTTWSQQSANLLLALAETAAGHTSALLLARSHGRQPHPTPRGEVFRISTAQPEPAAAPQLSEAWHTALAEAETALTAGHSVAVTGEAGSGKTALLATALAHTHPHDRVLNARPPDPRDADSWLTLWPPELGKDNTSVIVAGVDTLPAWTATALARLMQTEAQRPLTVTAREASTIPKELAYPIDTVVELPALRQRPEDIIPLAQHFGRQARGREVQFTPTAARALRTYHWPDNAKQLHSRPRGRGHVLYHRHPALAARSTVRTKPHTDTDRNRRTRRNRSLPCHSGNHHHPRRRTPRHEPSHDLPQDRPVRHPPSDLRFASFDSGVFLKIPSTLNNKLRKVIVAT